MSDALDRGRILNVAVAEAATVPALPSNHRSRVVFFGALLAAFMSVGLAFVSERLDSTFRTPDEVGSILNIPVLATIPQDGNNGAVVKYGS
jgi:capsular polysaccharide biosynthesis protein